MNGSLRDTARRWLAEGRAAFVVEVRATQGSVPREAGTRMLVAAGDCAGSIGGGHLEWEAIAEARALLLHGAQLSRETPPHERRVALGPSLGQCCGGTLVLRYERLSVAALAAWPAAAPRLFLQMYGAGHVGRALAHLLASLDVRVQWIDAREESFPVEPSPAHIERLCVEPAEAEVRSAPPGAHYLVFTHDHDLDLRITETVLRRADFAYLGLIGSRTKRARFEHRCLARGIAPEVLARMTCPIGVPGVAGKEPEVIALAVAAQLLQRGPGLEGDGNRDHRQDSRVVNSRPPKGTTRSAS